MQQKLGYNLWNYQLKAGITVNQKFLQEIEIWREDLARNIVLYNPIIQEYELNYAVQMVIHRILFLRMYEDRETAIYGKLFNLLASDNIYQKLIFLFIEVNNSKISAIGDRSNFHQQRKKKLDDLIINLKIDDNILKIIIAKLYPSENYHEFPLLPIEILGQVYEQFLGKFIKLSASHQVIIEDKLEVRKAGGIYYTPIYIVDYIVEQTIGKILAGKKPEKTQDITIVDPACGSGLFLIRAYQFLLNWYLQQYLQNTHKYKSKLSQAPSGKLLLTFAERKRILLSHIYGVDIDEQAVEITQLSLLLTALEDVSGETIKVQSPSFNQRVLSDLHHNIKCGNALIGADYNLDIQFDSVNIEEIDKINIFDWNQEFSTIMNQGGFKVIIGNPPYGAFLSHLEVEYINNKYEYQDYQLDTYMIFMEKSLKLIADHGKFGMIIPNTWLSNLKTPKIRNFIFSQTTIENIVDYRYPVFSRVVDTQTLILNKSTPPGKHQVTINIINKDRSQSEHKTEQKIWASSQGLPVNILITSHLNKILHKLQSLPNLELGLKVTQGTKPFQIGKGKPPQNQTTLKTKPFVLEYKKDETFRPLLRGSLIQRYQILWQEDYWISFGDWLAEPRYSANYDAPEKIVIRQTGDALVATLDCRQFIVRDNLYTIVLKEKFNTLNLKYFLGLINSKLLTWFYQTFLNSEKGEALAQVKKGHIIKLPIVYPDLSKSPENYLKLINLVEKMLTLHQHINEGKTPPMQRVIQQQIQITDRQINQLVYEIYSLTHEEIALIE